MDFSNFLVNTEQKRYIPLYVVFELTYRCNFSCRHCYRAAENRRELSKEKILTVLDELVDCGCLIVGFSGGEIFLREDFVDIAYAARKKGFALCIFTNGALISKRHIDILADLDLLKLQITLYGATPQTYSIVTGNPKSYSQVMRSLRLLKGKRIRTILSSQVTKYNYSELERMKAMAALFTDGRYPLKYNLRTLPAHDQRKETIECGISRRQLKEAIAREPLRFKNSLFGGYGDSPCGVGIVTACIGPYGDIYPCTHFRLSLGNISKQEFREIWDQSAQLGELREKLRKDFSTCRACNLQAYCTRCPALTFLKYGLNTPTYKTAVCQDASVRKGAFTQ
jgi:radical SAM protein with 4Fe4S-binding SPASM domain